MTTDFSNKINILGEFYTSYRDNKELEDFISFNDLGLPLAYLALEGLCEVTEDGIKYIIETWELLMAALNIEDTGFTSLEEVFSSADKKE